MQDTPRRVALFAPDGLRANSVFQLFPFHASASGFVPEDPTAVQFLADLQATADKTAGCRGADTVGRELV
jgi:hypothetical protein